jgi:hypothetical protein
MERGDPDATVVVADHQHTVSSAEVLAESAFHATKATTDRQNRRPQTEPLPLDAPARRIVRFVLLGEVFAGGRLTGGPYRCALCGAVIILPFDATPKVKVAAASGRPTWRILSIGNEEVHRCEMRTTRSEPANT